MVIGNALALILSVVDFITEGLFLRESQWKMKFISASAGVSVAYIFLILLPEIYTGAMQVSRVLFLSVLFGFGIFHLIEKYIRQNFTGPALRKEHKLIHSSTSFFYFFVVGFILVKLSQPSNPLPGILLFIPILLHIVIDSLPRRTTNKHHLRAISASAPFIGSLFALVIDMGVAGNTALLGIVGGALLYTVVRESLPRERQGKPLYFLTGLLAYTVFILMLWNVGFY
jgi:hypothetical protein